ncbi:MAB_1171c family putative transporter [Streptomyces iconiensis]|uniref:DUF6545 domain-containing protein n=1 Tax=Streptomyces iconiensis TaxID=1384038 RepID=A0ABT6ZUQ8_9ACTN|nr:MAB_1171c family putative transporter [Streptomyces iconiensis]MDJ1132786.1 hypothetical protein [Streptomyces iconiensis]
MAVILAGPLQAVLALLALGLKVFQLARNPYSAPLRAVTLCLLYACGAGLLALPMGARFYDGAVGGTVTRLAQNVMLLTACYFLMCFYLYSALDHASARHRARREATGLLVTVCTLAACVLVGAGDLLAGGFAEVDMAIPEDTVFYLVAELYLVYSLASSFYWTHRFARSSPRPLSTGLWIVAAGVSTAAVSAAVRVAFVLVRSQGAVIPAALTEWTRVLLMAAVSLFVTGVSYPVLRNFLTSARFWRRHRRFHRRLLPLWLLLSEAFPHVVLDVAGPRRRGGRPPVRGVHRRLHRRVIECRDGLVLILPYLTVPPGRGAVPGNPAAERAAALLREVMDGAALRLEPRAARECAPSATARGVPPSLDRQRDREADVHELLCLSDALRDAGPGRRRRTGTGMETGTAAGAAGAETAEPAEPTGPVRKRLLRL